MIALNKSNINEKFVCVDGNVFDQLWLFKINSYKLSMYQTIYVAIKACSQQHAMLCINIKDEFTLQNYLHKITFITIISLRTSHINIKIDNTYINCIYIKTFTCNAWFLNRQIDVMELIS